MLLVSIIAAQHIEGLRRRMHLAAQQKDAGDAADEPYSATKSMFSTFSSILFNSHPSSRQDEHEDEKLNKQVTSVSEFFKEVFNGFKILVNSIPSKRAKSHDIQNSVNFNRRREKDLDGASNFDLNSPNFNNKEAYYNDYLQQRELSQLGTPMDGVEQEDNKDATVTSAAQEAMETSGATKRAVRATIPKNPCDPSAFYVTYNTTSVCVVSLYAVCFNNQFFLNVFL